MKTSFVEKKFIFTVILLSIIPLIGLLLLSKTLLFKLPFFAPGEPKTSQAISKDETASKDFPIDPSDSHVKSLMLFYTIEGTITSVSDTTITLDALPPFPVKKASVKIYKASAKNNKGTPAVYTDIQKGEKAILYIMYTASTKTWYVSQVSLE